MIVQTIRPRDFHSWPIENLSDPFLAAIWPDAISVNNQNIILSGKERIPYVDVYRIEPDIWILKSTVNFDFKISSCIKFYIRMERNWRYVIGKIVDIGPVFSKRYFFRVQSEMTSENLNQDPFCYVEESNKICPLFSDYEFFRTVPFLKAIHRDAVCPLLNNIVFQFARAGEKFINQGEVGEACYIVQDGLCQVIIEKDGEQKILERIGPKEFVGEMALLTGEPRTANVVAEIDTRLWVIDKALLEDLINSYPEVRTFLTEIIADRFASQKLTADRTIGKYRIKEILGRGGYSIVYKGIHEDLNRRVAIKMLHHDKALNADFFSNFKNEAKIIASLNNEHIVKVYDIEERYRTIFLVMEFLEGLTLRQKLKESLRLNEKEALNILIRICRGLEYAHRKGLVHQDIKPGNIFILSDGEVKILDFGLACSCGSENFMSGTPFYMAPEQVECLSVDERTDIYALGLMVYEMLIGERPFSEENPFMAMNLHSEQDIPDPAEKVPAIHQELRDFILKACRRNPDERYQNMGEVLKDLHPLSEEFGLSSEILQKTKQKISTILLLYNERQQLLLNQILEDFSEKIKREKIGFKITNFDN